MNNSNLGRGTFGKIVTVNYLSRYFSSLPELWGFNSNLKLEKADLVFSTNLVCKIYLGNDKNNKDGTFALNALYNYDKFSHIVEYLAQNIDLDVLKCYDYSIGTRGVDSCNNEMNTIPELALELSKNMRVGQTLSGKSCLYENIVLCRYIIDEINYIFPVYQKFDGDMIKFTKINLDNTILTWDKIAGSILKSLVCLHKNDLYHFDIKPANILFLSATSSYLFVLCDYGMVSTTNTTNYFKGTYQFQSIFSLMIPGEYQDACLISITNADKCEKIANSYDYMSNIKSIVNANNSNNSCDKISKDPIIQKMFVNSKNTAKNCKNINNSIWKNIFRKNDLYSLGVTMCVLEKNMKLNLDKNRKLFIDKLLFGIVGDSFYDANTALQFLSRL